MRKTRGFQPSGFWFVTGAAVLWGTIGVATQAIYQLDNTTSLFINLMRTLVATPILLVACWRVVGRQFFAIARRDLFVMVASGTLLAASHAAYFGAIRATGVTIATLLTICVAPVVVTLLAVLLRFETLTRRVVLALGCALVGALLLVGLHAPEGSGYDLLLGTGLSLVAAVTYASVIICGRFLAAGCHPLQVTAVSFSAGSVALLLVNLLAGVVPIQSAQGWLLVLYLGIVPSALAYWMLQTGLRSVSATAASIIGMLDPVVAALLAWVLFGETLAATGIAGAALLMVSIFLLPRNQQA